MAIPVGGWVPEAEVCLGFHDSPNGAVAAEKGHDAIVPNSLWATTSDGCRKKETGSVAARLLPLTPLSSCAAEIAVAWRESPYRRKVAEAGGGGRGGSLSRRPPGVGARARLFRDRFGGT